MGRQQNRDETAGAGTGRDALALVPREPDSRDEPPRARHRGGRPMAAFVTQLMLGADASLQVTRLERTRNAAAQYARVAASLAGKRSA